MAVDKCGFGYIKNQKKVHFIWLFVFVVIGVAIFLGGYLWLRTRANIFTVLAVLMVLPAAKRIVALVVMLPRKSVERERYDKMSRAAGGGILLADYVFTSTEKIVHLDFVLIKSGNVLGVTAPSRQDVEYMKKYLTDSVHKVAPSFHVKVFGTDGELLRYLDGMAQAGTDLEPGEKVREYLLSLAV